MKRNIFTLFITLLAISSVSAQTRYIDEVFSDVTISSNVKYAENYSFLSGSPALADLTMDVYEPADDTVGGTFYDNARPVVIFMHPGSFLPKGLNTLPFGNNRDSSVVEICTQLAKRGFVAAAISYRIGWNPFGASDVERAKSIINAVYRANQDAHAAIRFFRKDADTDNTYNIDPYRVVVGGTNSGGYVALAVNSLNRTSEISLLKFLDGDGNSFVDQTVTGGFYGEGGLSGFNVLNNPGYSSAPAVVLNMGGAVGDTTWINDDEAPIVSFHGEADPLTPFRTAVVIVSSTGQSVVEVSGGFDISKQADGLGIQDKIKPTVPFSDVYTTVAESRSSNEGLFPFPGATNGYEPWSWYDAADPNIDNATAGASGFGSRANPFATKTKALLYIDTVMGYFIPRALEAFANVDSVAVETADPADTVVIIGIADVAAINAALTLYPNPAATELNLSLANGSYNMSGVKVYDITGRLVLTNNTITNPQYHRISLSNLESGSYIVTISFETGEQVSKRLLVR
jgi:hypothetical protein